MNEFKKMLEIDTLKEMSLEEINTLLNKINDENKMLKEIINAKNTISDDDVEELNRYINEDLPHNGEWWSDGYEDFEVTSKNMLARGFTVDEIKTTFESLYNAVLSEFGE